MLSDTYTVDSLAAVLLVARDDVAFGCGDRFSVRPSVTGVSCNQMADFSGNLLIPSNNPGTSWNGENLAAFFSGGCNVEGL